MYLSQSYIDAVLRERRVERDRAARRALLLRTVAERDMPATAPAARPSRCPEPFPARAAI